MNNGIVPMRDCAATASGFMELLSGHYAYRNFSIGSGYPWCARPCRLGIWQAAASSAVSRDPWR